MLKELLEEYKLPALPEKDTRKTCLELLQKYEFGVIPPAPKSLNWEVIDASDVSFAGGKAVPTTVRLYGTTTNDREFSFPIRVCVPADGKNIPFFIHLNFRPNIPDKYQPTEEIIDNGFAVISLCYKEITQDNADFTDGLASAFYPTGKRESKDAPGKIALWAWAAMRAMDYAQAELSDQLDFNNAAITGHSRLGKTALLCGAYDERFQFVFANCAGCAGDALERHKTPATENGRPEAIHDVALNFGYWFCKEYQNFADGSADALPFDQHYLTACIAPRKLYLASAALDFWADPTNQFMNCIAISSYYNKLGLDGIICPDRLPLIGEAFPLGNIGYHYRPGMHSQTRTDWLYYMDFFKRHRN